MRLRSIICCLAVLPLAPGFSQSEETTVAADAPKPKQPIVLKAPNRAMWKVTTRYKKAVFEDMGSQGKQRTNSVAEIRKENKVIRELLSRDGVVYETYIIGPIRLSNFGKKGFVKQVSDNDWGFSQYGEVDFDRFRWVDMSNYAGVGDYKGRKVFVFKVSGEKKKLNAAQQNLYEQWKAKPEGPKPPYVSDSVAMLDVETQLPVYYSDEEVDEAYEFLTPPAQVFAIPDDFKKVLVDRVSYLKATNAL